MSKNQTAIFSKKDEKRVLDAQSEKMRKDPAYAAEVLKKAGILNKSGQLTAYYRQKV